MNIGSIKPNDQGILIGRVQTMAFVATIALQEVNSTNERAPAFDVLALAADRRSWVKVGAVWEYTSNETGECFLSGRIDDPSLDKPIDVAMFQQNDGSYNVAWRRPQRKRPLPTMAGSDDLPPLSAVGDVARSTRTFTPADVSAFAQLTHDDNPLHADEDFASLHRFGGTVVHGMLYACMFSAIIGQRSPGAVYLSQTLNFKKPVMLGDTVTAEIEVERVARGGRLLDFETRCVNQRSEL